MPCTPKHRPAKNLDDLLSTLNFNVNPEASESTSTTIEEQTRPVVTNTPQFTNIEQTSYAANELM